MSRGLFSAHWWLLGAEDQGWIVTCFVCSFLLPTQKKIYRIRDGDIELDGDENHLRKIDFSSRYVFLSFCYYYYYYT